LPGKVVITETFPAECYGWFSGDRFGSKRKIDDRKRFGASLLRWADEHTVAVEGGLRMEIQGGFPKGDDAFDAVVGLFGVLKVCLGERATGEPDECIIRQVEGWILGRESYPQPLRSR
jgi:hypothetical protein